MFGRPVIHMILIAFLAVIVYLLAKELLPMLFGLVDVVLSGTLVKLLALLIAIGVLYGGWNRGVVV